MAHNVLHRGAQWVGKTLKPGGVTGAYMDAGLLGWPDIIGGASRGLLDYMAQREAANAWRPITAPAPPPANAGQSLDIYNASLANAVNQRVALRNLKLQNQLYKELGVGPSGAGLVQQNQNAATAVPSVPVRLPPAPSDNIPFVTPTAGGAGRDYSKFTSGTLPPPPPPLRTSTTGGGWVNDLPDAIKRAAAMSGDPMKTLSAYYASVGSRTPNYEWYVSPQLNDGKPVQLSDAHAQAYQSMPNIRIRPHETKPTMMTVVDSKSNKPVQITSRQYNEDPDRYSVHSAKDWETKPYIVDGNVDYMTALEADAVTGRSVVPFARDMLTPRSVLINGIPLSVTSADLMRLRAEAKSTGTQFVVTPYDASLQPVSAARHAQARTIAQIGRLEQGERYVEQPDTETPKIELIPGSESWREFHENRNKNLTTYQAFVLDSGNTIARIDRIIKGFETDPWLSEGLAFMTAWRPGSKQREIMNDLDGILNVIGFDALAEMRNNSESGASGLGQLTEKELEVLQGLQGKLDAGDPAGLLRNIKQIRERMVTMGERMRVAYNEDYGDADDGAYKLEKPATKYPNLSVLRHKETGVYQIMFDGKWITEKDFRGRATEAQVDQFDRHIGNLPAVR